MSMKRIYSEQVAIGKARREGRQPSHDGEYITIYWSDDGRWFACNNAGLDHSDMDDGGLEAATEQLPPNTWLDEQEYELALTEARETDAEIAKLVAKSGTEDQLTKPSLVGYTARDLFVELGWVIREEVDEAQEEQYHTERNQSTLNNWNRLYFSRNYDTAKDRKEGRAMTQCPYCDTPHFAVDPEGIPRNACMSCGKPLDDDPITVPRAVWEEMLAALQPLAEAAYNGTLPMSQALYRCDHNRELSDVLRYLPLSTITDCLMVLHLDRARTALAKAKEVAHCCLSEELE